MPWEPGAAMENLRIRARVLSRIRGYFEGQGVLEVDTPALSRSGVTDPHIESFVTRYTGPHLGSGEPGEGLQFLHTSPEFPMKRLLCAGSGPIYQICKVFRNGEAGRRHNPEFSMLEWYRPGMDHMALMEEVEALLRYALEGVRELPAAQWLTYREAFIESLGIDPFTSDARELRHCALREGVDPPDGLFEVDAWLDLLLTHRVEPSLPAFTFLYDYPASQAALARIRTRETPVAERFEVYLDGVELANGFHELADAEEQGRRFDEENQQRHALGLPQVPRDDALLAALNQGLPDCAGVALGVDRLMMYALHAKSLDEVMAFSYSRA